MSSDDARRLGLAARAMDRHGLAHAYGHVSVRQGPDRFLVSPPRPMGHMGVGDPGVEVRLGEPLPSRALGEVRVHSAIYERRPEVGAVCRVQPPAVMALSALGRTPRALHGPGAYFAPCAPLWPGVALLRDDAQAAAVAETLGAARAIVLRGNGCVTVGRTIEEAAVHAFYLEDAARVELALIGAAEAVREYTAEEASCRAVSEGGIYERMWAYLCYGDPEWGH